MGIDERIYELTNLRTNELTNLRTYEVTNLRVANCKLRAHELGFILLNFISI